MRSNFKNCIYAHKIVCNSRPIYEYNLDAMPMLLVRSLIYGRLNFKNCNPVEYELHVNHHRARAFVVYFAELTVDFSMKA